jgi:hypothetical protein
VVKKKYLPPHLKVFEEECREHCKYNNYIDTTVFDTRIHNLVILDFFYAGSFFGVSMYISTPEQKFPKNGDILIVKEKPIKEEEINIEKNQIWLVRIIFTKPFATYKYQTIPTKNGEAYGIILCTFDLSLFNLFYKNLFTEKEA